LVGTQCRRGRELSRIRAYVSRVNHTRSVFFAYAEKFESYEKNKKYFRYLKLIEAIE